MVPVPLPVSRLSSWAIVPLRLTVPVPLPPVTVTPESPSTTVMAPSVTLKVAMAPEPASSTSLTVNPVPSIDRADLFGRGQGAGGCTHHGGVVHGRDVDGDLARPFLVRRTAREARIRARVALIVHGHREGGTGAGSLRAVQVRDRAGAAAGQQVIQLGDGAAQADRARAVAAGDGDARVAFGYRDGAFGHVQGGGGPRTCFIHVADREPGPLDRQGRPVRSRPRGRRVHPPRGRRSWP